MQIGVISGSFRKASMWVKLVSGSKWRAARSAGDTQPVAERRDPAAPGSLHAAQHSQRDERGELTLHTTGAPWLTLPTLSSCCPWMDQVQPLLSWKECTVKPQLNAGWWDFFLLHFGVTWTGCDCGLHFVTICGNRFHHCTLCATANSSSLSVWRFS